MSQQYSDAQQDSLTAKINTYDTELENGILNMIVSLCLQKSATCGMDEAKIQVSNWLERILIGLREANKQNIFGE